MQQISANPGTPKEGLRAISILVIALIAGVVMFSVIVIVLNLLNGPALSADKRNISNFLLIVLGVLAIVCFWIAVTGYKKGIDGIKNFSKKIDDKLNQYRIIFIRYMALCEAPALFGVIIFFLAGNYVALIITGLMLVAMVTKLPNKKRIIDELGLDWDDQKELE